METLGYLLIGVSIVLAVGLGVTHLWGTISGQADNTSQRVMRWRVSLQFAALIAVAAIFFLNSAG